MILAIESSCDDSAISLFDPCVGMRAELSSSQVAIHQQYGGVVPDLASREHLTNLPVLLEQVLDQYDKSDITRIAVTRGPGLAGCLALGIALAKSLGTGLNVPVVGVNHLRGHAFSPFITTHAKSPSDFDFQFKSLLPHLGLLVSGGNTLLFGIDTERRITVFAQTVDDAAGEALDKGAKLLGYPYPGGPVIEKLAENGNARAFDFPRAFSDTPDLKFSFSGLKTSLRYRLEKMDDGACRAHLSDLCASYQEAVISALLTKVRQSVKLNDFASVGLSGGVSNNNRLRAGFMEIADECGIPALLAERKHTGDNAAMIAFAAWIDPSVDKNPPDLAPSLQLSID